MNNIQDTIKGTLDASATTTSFKKQIKDGYLKQVQAYHNHADPTVSIDIEINDVSGSPIIQKQPIQNLRSRDGHYFANMPINGKGGTQLEVVITTSSAIEVPTNFSVVFDIENNSQNC